MEFFIHTFCFSSVRTVLEPALIEDFITLLTKTPLKGANKEQNYYIDIIPSDAGACTCTSICI